MVSLNAIEFALVFSAKTFARFKVHKYRYKIGLCTIDRQLVKLLKALLGRGLKCKSTFLARWALLAKIITLVNLVLISEGSPDISLLTVSVVTLCRDRNRSRSRSILLNVKCLNVLHLQFGRKLDRSNLRPAPLVSERQAIQKYCHHSSECVGMTE
jgi:hypothetical protein